MNLCALASLREISKRVESGRQNPEDGGQMAEIIAMDADPPWKDILERYFVQFIEFFFPHIFSEIDWERGHEFLDKELQKIMRSSKTGRRTVDKLVKVRLKDGSEIWALIHVEIQGKSDSGFAKRMYVYNYRLFDKHDKKIVSLAVLTDDRKSWKNVFPMICISMRRT